MEMKKHLSNRQLSEPFTCRYWQDNYDLLMSISEETGRKPNEVARDLMDDALRRHLSTTEPGDNGEIMQKLGLLIEQNRLTTQVYEQLIEKYEQLDERSTRLKQGLIQNLREFYAILLESLSASIGARRLAWNYVSHTVLKQTGFNDEQVKQRYEAEKKAWIDEKDNIARAIEEAIKKMPLVDPGLRDHRERLRDRVRECVRAQGTPGMGGCKPACDPHHGFCGKVLFRIAAWPDDDLQNQEATVRRRAVLSRDPAHHDS